MSPVPLYLSHSYRRQDRNINDYFWQIFSDADFSFTVDPVSPAVCTTALELMMARSAGYVGIVTFRPQEQHYQCSPFVMHEFSLAVQMHRPRLVLRDKRVPPRYFRGEETIEIEFDVAAPGRCTEALKLQLGAFHTLTSSLSANRRYRRGRVGIALATQTDPSASARYTIIEEFLDKCGHETVDITTFANDPLALAQNGDECDFVVIDLDGPKCLQIADFLLGRGIPLLKAARRGGPVVPELLLGSAPLLAAAAADELVTYWSAVDEFEFRMGDQISRVMTDRIELAGFEDGHRYFRSLGRETRPVFISNAGSANHLARDLAQALLLENIPFFHYRYQNPIGWGQRWTDQLDRMIGASKIFMPLIDDSYWDREYCQKEYETAVQLERAGQITITPMLLDGHAPGIEIPYQGADLRDRPPREQVQIVVSRLDDLLAAKASTGPAILTPEPVQAGQVSVDVAIITILKEEYEAVLRLLKQVRSVTGSAIIDNQHAWVVGEVNSPGERMPYVVALAMSPRAGTNAAAITTKNTIQAVDPRCVLVVGIAGGLTELKIGDVVVADRICAYEYGKIDRGFRPRHDLDSPTDSALVSAARTLAARYPTWYRDLDQPGDLRHLSPTIEVGQVASGDKVVDDPTDSFFASVRRSRPRLIAVEMEGSGAATAIQDIREMQRAVSFGMIRGISDLPRIGGSQLGSRPGRSAQTDQRDSSKVIASAAAAAAAIQLIRLSWPRPPRAAS
jgi:nucleoside phosphorylase